MAAFYMGVKKVEAWPQEKDGRAGYAVRYEGGYTSWSPADVFERSYFELSEPDGSKLTEYDINRFLTLIETQDLDKKTTLVRAELKNGFVAVEASSCVDPKNYDHAVGEQICLERIKDKIWASLGFVLQWANFGLRNHPED